MIRSAHGARALACVSTALAVVLLAPGLAAAQSAGAPGATAPLSSVEVIGTKPTGKLELDTASTTGSRLGLTVLETPASIQVIPGELIRDHGDRTVLDAESRATGLSTIPTPGNGGTALSARGFTGVTSVMQLYDGLQLYVGSGTVTFPFDTWTIDRLEVLSGPASVLYGTGATGGTINVVPRSPDPKTRSGEALLAGGSYGTFRGAVDLTGPIAAGLSGRLDVSYNQSDGWIDRGHSDSTAVSASLRWDATPNLAFILSDDYGDQNPMQYYGDPVINGSAVESLRSQNYNVADAIMHFKDNWAQFKTEWTPLSNLKIRNTLYLLTTDRHWRNEENFAYQPATQLLLRNGYLEILHDEHQEGDHLDVSYSQRLFGIENDLSFGAEVNRIRYQNTSNSPFPGSSTINPYSFTPGLFIHAAPTTPVIVTHTDQSAAFLEDRIKLTRQFSLVGGVRHDRYELERLDARANTTTRRAFDTTSWRIGAVYQPWEPISLYGQYSQSTDPVSSLISLSPAQQIFDLTTGKMFEAGIKASLFKGRVQATLAGYNIVKNNLLAPVPGMPTVSQQIGQQSSKGVEAQISAQLDYGFALELNGTALDAQYDNFAETVAGVRIDRSGNQPVNVPDSTANGFLTWKHGPLTLRSGVRYVAKRFTNNANTLRLPAYIEIDAGARYEINSRLYLDLNVENLNDAFYATSSYNAGTQWILGRPRTVELTLHGRF